jgi:alcohol dehydrogenase class IV
MMTAQYQLRIPGFIACGESAMDQLPGLLSGFRKAAVFTDPGVLSSGTLEIPLSKMRETGMAFEVLSCLPAEPSADQAQEVIQKYKGIGADVIVAVGGGSVMDVAKLAGVLGGGAGTVRDFMKDPALGKKTVKIIMIPTTAGTGSEATPNSIVTLPEENLKVGIVHEALMADQVILDPAMIRRLPKKIAASTGMDALAHAIECFTSRKATPVSDMYALEALKMIFANIEDAVNGQEDMQAKEKMLLASFYGGVAITASGTTAVHALSYPLGGKYHIPHGIANAILLLPVMRYNEPAIRDRLCIFHDAVRPGQIDLYKEEKSAWVLGRLEEIIRNLEIPANLAPYGVGRDALNELVKAGMKVTRLLVNNMREVTPEAARSIYLQVL